MKDTRWILRVLALTLGAFALRLLLFLARGDYLAFDEGWYLLLGRSLVSGKGYSLIGVPHITLSPLFPILAGWVGKVVGSWVWGGRLVAALASALLLFPLWGIFRRLASPKTAFTALVLVAVLPSMAPFLVPFFVGADLWVGAEPVLHLLLFTGVLLWLKASEGERTFFWLLSGMAFGMAFLARPEAIVTWGLLGLWALMLAPLRRSLRPFLGAVVMGVGFLSVGAPYWVYLHGVTGEWALTGRGINPAANVAKVVQGRRGGGSSGTIEEMLWADDDTYARRLYGLDGTGLRLRSDYWGVYPPSQERDSASSVENPGMASGNGETSVPIPPLPLLYGRALLGLFPALLWAFVLLGLMAPRKPEESRREIPVMVGLLGTSFAIAILVAADPRTQLFLVPVLAFYAARGFGFLDAFLSTRWTGVRRRKGFVEGLLVLSALLGLLGVSAPRLYLSFAFGSPHHIVAAHNRQVAEGLDTLLGPGGGPVASWHPAIALYAGRDWRVLPFADLNGIVRYGGASGAEAVVLSAYYPPRRGEEILGTRYMVLPVPGDATIPGEWRMGVVRGDSLMALGYLQRQGRETLLISPRRE
jgi:hypothetical protein